MIVSRRRLISVFAVAAVWSITLTFFQPVFWATTVFSIVLAYLLILRADEGPFRFNSAILAKLSIILFICIVQIIWGSMNNFYNIEEVAFLLIGALLAIILSFVKVSATLSWLPFYTMAIIFVVAIALGVDPEDLLARNSRNFLSVILLALFASAILMSKPRYVTKAHFVAAFVLIFISVISVGRSGILFSCLLFLLLLAKSMMEGRRTISKTLRNAVFIAVLGLVGLVAADVLLGFAPRLVARGFSDYSRLTITLVYFSDISVAEFLFGRNYFELAFLDKFSFNLHNSYLAAWANLGLGYLILVIFCIGKALFTIRLFPFLWIPVLALGGRAATDVQMIGAKYDYVFLTILFLQQRSKYFFEEKRHS